MGERAEVRRTGCGQVVVVGSMLLWLGAVLVGVMFLVDSMSSRATAPGVVTAVVAAISIVVLLLPYVGVAFLTRSRDGWEATAAVASGFVITVGYLLLDVAMRAMFTDSSIGGRPQGFAPTLIPALSLQAGVALRFGVFFLYALLVAWLAPRLAGASRRRLWEWLGLGCVGGPAARPRSPKSDLAEVLPTWLLSLAVVPLVTIPWPVTGALGDSLTSLNLAFQTLVWAIPPVLIFWGVVFCLLTSSFARPWMAALMTIMLYGLTTLGAVLPMADWGALEDGIYLLPMALLLTELRARECGTYPLLLVAFCYRVAPLLFVDARDVIVNGAPEPEHIASYRFVVVMTIALGIVLWGGRRLLLALWGHVQVPDWARFGAVTLAALVMWGVWGGLYAFAGEPGFANDGFLIILEEQADGSTELAEVLGAARAIPDREARLQYVYEALVEAAERTQAPLRAELDGLGVSYRPYYIINMIRVDGHRWLMRRFEGRPGVAQVLLNPNVREYPHSIPSSYYGGDGKSSEEVQPNLAAIHADEAWAMGVMGEGIVVAGQDTGYDWTHPALKSHYRGWDGQNADHDTNWHDAWDGTVVPFDDDSHGTHTMGIVLGDDGASNRTGVAPGAQWIGCRNMRRGFGNPGSYAECMEFFLAPYPCGGDPFTDGDVSLAPHVINNSWGCPDFEGCFPDTLEPAAEALRAAGIMVVVSAGNDGPFCATATAPLANYDAVFSVGATDSDGDIVGFSSRGPVDGLIKPDIAAPGAYVRSSVPGGGYGYAGGTSMAGPHVAGLVALLWSANPALIGDVDATEMLICQTAAPKPVEAACVTGEEAPEGPFAELLYNPICACGGVTGVPNNVYGCGFVDAGAAVRAAVGQ